MKAAVPEPVLDAFYRTLDWLESEGLPYCVLGRFAFQVHGIARATFDVDHAVLAGMKKVSSSRPPSHVRPSIGGGLCRSAAARHR